MNGQVKDIWVSALRSGKYEQGRGYLHSIEGNQHKFCCLGVLCEVALENGIELSLTEGSISVNYDQCSATLPTPVVAWAELSTEWGFYNDEKVPGTDNEFTCGLLKGSLTGANDNGWNFLQIADWIDENL